MTRGVRPQGAEAVSDAERRRGIALVLDRQPEIDLDELQRILARVGIVVDADTLVSDLDALGYDVDDDDPDGPVTEDIVVVPVDEAPGVDEAHGLDDGAGDGPVDLAKHDDAGGEPDAFADPAERRPSFLSPPPRPVGDGEDDDRPAEGTWSRQSLIVAAGVVLAVILVAVFLAGGSDDDPEDTTAGDSTDQTASAGADGGSESTGPTEPVVVAPVGPGSDPALDVPATRTDDFERGDIGDFPDVGTWEIVAGEFANEDGNLAVTARPDEGAAVIGVDVGNGDVRAQVQVDRRASRSGLAFRIVDDENFFVWTTVPEYATTILFQVVDGEPTSVADSGLTATGDGLPALGVNLVGTKAELLHDGVVVATYDGLPPAEGATRIGVAALSDSTDLPLFDEFKVLTP